ncbi:MAG: arginyltransferase [Deltaproteobacteria bacterium]|nr:arginyltransferase [Deltaproteobacteria bacterium]
MAQTLLYDGLQSCPYLPGRVARLPLYRQDRRLNLDETDVRFATAERRVGTALYHTACPTCRACEGLRISVPTFEPTRSQRRVLSRWGDDTRVEIGAPTVNEAKLALYNRHKQMRGLADADDVPMNALGYSAWLISSCFLTIEMRYWWKDRLVGVGLVDLGRTSASSVYFYFDPDPEVARLSPGVYSVLREIELCRATGRDHLYLGLYVEDCRHLTYKAEFRPNERLRDGDWRCIR